MTSYQREFHDPALRPVPTVTGTQMAIIDRLMMERIGVSTWQLMEIAGFAVAQAIHTHYRGRVLSILFLAGSGGNGGDAMVAARWLAGWGYACQVITTKAHNDLNDVAAHQLASLEALGIPVITSSRIGDSLPKTDLIVDGLLGFSLKGNPRGEAARMIRLANASGTRIASIDLPSGLNADTGEQGTPIIRADLTVTLALPKTGLTRVDPTVTGSVILADIGVPWHLYREVGVDVSPKLFTHGFLIPLAERV